MADTRLSLSQEAKEAAAWGEGVALATGNCTWLGPWSSHPRSAQVKGWQVLLVTVPLGAQVASCHM